jgi:hypothetical protein
MAARMTEMSFFIEILLPELDYFEEIKSSL